MRAFLETAAERDAATMRGGNLPAQMEKIETWSAAEK